MTVIIESIEFLNSFSTNVLFFDKAEIHTPFISCATCSERENNIVKKQSYNDTELLFLLT